MVDISDLIILYNNTVYWVQIDMKLEQRLGCSRPYTTVQGPTIGVRPLGSTSLIAGAWGV